MSNTQQITKKEEDIEMNVPVCGANLETPVGDQSYYINEIHYNIGNIKYIENAD